MCKFKKDISEVLMHFQKNVCACVCERERSEGGRGERERGGLTQIIAKKEKKCL